MTEDYKGLIIWLTVPASDELLRGEVMDLNHLTQLMEILLHNHGIFILDRDGSLRNLPDELQSQCEGFHPKHVLTDEHVQWLLTALCPRPSLLGFHWVMDTVS